jgi:hypothetical protein
MVKDSVLPSWADIPEREMFHPSGPRLFRENDGSISRLIFHEDKRERAAFRRLVNLYSEQVDEINRLCEEENTTAFEFRLWKPDYETQLGWLQTPWKRGQQRRWILLAGDKPSVSGAFRSFLSFDDTRKSIHAVRDHLKEAAEKAASLAALVNSTCSNHHELLYAWANDLPTLGEFMEEEREARRAGKVGAL